MKLTDIKAVVFDVDGVLLDTNEIHKKLKNFFRKVFSIVGVPVGVNKDEASGNLRGKDIISVLKNAGWEDWKIEFYVKIWTWLELRHKPKVFKGVNQVIQSCKYQGKVIGLLTNRGMDAAVKPILQSGLDWRKFDFFVTYEAISKGSRVSKLPNHFFAEFSKPDHRAIDVANHIIERLPGYPASVLYIGDNLIDYYFARDNGFNFIGVLSGEIKNPDVWINAGVKNIIVDVAQLIPYLMENELEEC